MTLKIFDDCFLEQADCATSLPAFELFRGKDGMADYASKASVSQETANTVYKALVNAPKWLSFASEVYKTSPDPADHIVVPTIIMPTDLPNRNLTAFPRDELVRFDPEIGNHVYKGWNGKPVYVDHKNQDYTTAIGAVADTHMRKINDAQGGLWKVIALMAIDRTKNPRIADDIINGRRRTYSMGAMVKEYHCSICSSVGTVRSGIKDKYEAMPCGREHAYFDRNGHFRKVPSKGDRGKQALGFLNARKVKPFEISSVTYPAFASAFTPENQISDL